MLVDGEWLAAHLGDPGIAVVDMRWRGDGSGRALFEQGHIPGATYLDWSTDIVDPGHPVAFMLAPPDRFAEAMQDAGIGNHTTVVAYADELGSGPFRLWWGCRTYGHDNVHVLDGGLERWVEEGRPLSLEAPSAPDRVVTWTPHPSPRWVASAADVAFAVNQPHVVVLDSRPPEQYLGQEVWYETGPIPADERGVASTPRGEIRAGRVPGAASIPSAMLYHDDHTMRSPEEIRGLLAGSGWTPGCRAITYCGVGISASALLFALRLAGVDEASLYDASWEEWGRDPARPVARD